jgi:cell wall-associated NlpC family hydrolase
MAQTQRAKGFPTYEFESDPLPPQPEAQGGQAESAPTGFSPTETVHLGDMAFEVTRRVDGETPWRDTGNTDFEHFQRAISRAFPPASVSPLADEAREMYDILREAGLTRYAAALLWHEKKNDTWPDSPIPQHFHNPYATRDRERIGEWERHPSYAAATRAWVARLNTLPYREDRTIAEFVHSYAPREDGNLEEIYVSTLADEINALPIEDALATPPKGKAITVAGLANPIFVPTDFPFESILTPPGPNRPGRHMIPTGVTQHETNNRRDDARDHSNWQDTGTPGHPHGFVGVHFYVDDTVVIQKIPINETSIHAGSPGNESHISIELCVHEGRDVQRAERNAAVLAAALLRDGLGQGVESLKAHDHWSLQHPPCPRVLLEEGRWPSYTQTVGALIREVAGTQPVFPGLPANLPVEVFLALFPQANPDGPVTRFYIDYCVKHLPPGQWPRLNGTKELGDGTTWWDFNPLHIFSDGQGKVWIAASESAGPEAATAPGSLESAQESARGASPPGDAAKKAAAVARDRERRRATTSTQAKLFAAPKGAVIRTLPPGTRLTVLGKTEDRFVPVAVRNGGAERGYVRENELADDPDDEGKDKGKSRRGRKGKDPGKGREPGVDPDTGKNGHRAGDDAGRHIAQEARRHIGSPYVFATHGPDTFDCSGLVHWVLLQATGLNVSPDSHAQFNRGTPVEWDVLQPGDIVFYDTQGGAEVREGNTASHVGIYVDSGRMVNAFNEQKGVREEDAFSDYFKPKYLGARRMA